MKHLLDVDAPKEIDRIAGWMRETILKQLGRKGAIIAISGGIDSSVAAALCVRALKPERVLALLLPETESSDDNSRLGSLLARHIGVEAITETITPMLEAEGCYRRRDEAISALIPEYRPDWKSKIVLPSVVDSDSYRLFSDRRASAGRDPEARPADARSVPQHRGRHELQAAQPQDARVLPRRSSELRRRRHAQPARIRPGVLREAGRRRRRPETDRPPLQDAGLRAGRRAGVPEEIRTRPPTTDTYSLPQTQEEFYFSLPYDQMDLCLYAKNHGIAAAEVAAALARTPVQIERVFRDIDAKRKMARYLHSPPIALPATVS